jgi:hypothetical protein
MQYIEHCKATVAGINLDELAALPLGPEVGMAGSGFKFCQLGQLGQLGIDGRQEWIGAKVPRMQVTDVQDRLRQEVPFLAYCLDSQPRLRSRVPNFMGILAVEGSDACALLTEDVSRGGQFGVHSRRASHDSRALFYVSFSQLGGYRSVLDVVELDFTTAFDVDGEERLLDFTPLPVNKHCITREAKPEYWQLHDRVSNEIEALTVTVPGDSPLGRAVRNECDFPWNK